MQPNRPLLSTRPSYMDLVAEITHDLEEYEAIKNGQLNLFSVGSIDELGWRVSSRHVLWRMDSSSTSCRVAGFRADGPERRSATV